MRHLSLFSGAGGSEWAAILLGWNTLGYVERDDYCQRVLAARIKDGIFPNSPIFGDIRTFIDQGYADAYQGMVDVVSAGFPCQPFSVAGKNLGERDDRNLWPETLEVIRRVRPRFALLENVPNLLTDKYVRRIFGDLAELGFDAEWMCLSAAQVGAPHRRKRLWVLADANGSRQLQPRGGICEQRQWAGNRTWWPAEPDVDRVAYGVADGGDRIGALGNGWVPAVAVRAWSVLTGER